MVFFYYKNKKVAYKGDEYMLKEEICKKREELNQSILEGKEYNIIYNLSTELDELIAKYYRGEEIPARRGKIKGNKLIIVN